MCTGFAVSDIDVWTVLSRRMRVDIDYDDNRIQEIFDGLDHGAIERQALRCNDMDAQTEAAFEEIEQQIRESADFMAVIGKPRK